MLRITTTEDRPGEITLRLEGSIVADWVPVLERECLGALRRTRNLRLDFLHVLFVDCAGAELIRTLQGRGARVVRCPPLIREQMEGCP